MMNLVRFMVVLALLVVLGWFPAVSAEVGPDTGFLTALSIPSGASVQVDGREIGTTPLIGIPVEAGAHTLPPKEALPGGDHTQF
jgi:hypothetical protein